MRKHLIICGPAGSGKTKLAQTIAQMFDPSTVCYTDKAIPAPNDEYAIDPLTELIVFDEMPSLDIARNYVDSVSDKTFIFVMRGNVYIEDIDTSNMNIIELP